MLGRVSHILWTRLGREDGFTMITVLGAMLVVMLGSAVAIAAATNDLGGGSRDKATKQALSAAEAGVNDYSYHLSLDNNYWAQCDGVKPPAKVNQANAPNMQWRNLPGTNADYAIELLPANGKPACSTTDASGTMIDTSTGTFRIRVTGRVPVGKDAAGNPTYAKRTQIVTYRRKGFLDFLYFTYYETSDPALYKLDTGGRLTRKSSSDASTLLDWAASACGKTYYRDGRGSLSWSGQINDSNNNWISKTASCNEIQFADTDQVRGPLHTNDSLLVCGAPVFGRNSADLIETEASASSNGGAWRPNCAGSSPSFVGTLRPGASHVETPTSNSSLKTTATSDGFFTGATQIQLNGAANTMTVTNTNMGLSGVTRALPANGVIYVADGTCGATYDPLSPSTPASNPGCGNVFVKGTYSKDLTIAAESDVVIRGSVTKTNDSVLGLIANQFVRVNHPVSQPSSGVTSTGAGYATCSGNNTTDPFSFTDVQIDAAILALNHSFTVDNYFCGAPLGTLTVNGVIAQQYRGPVGTGSNGSIATGYVKNYNYDTRLSLRQPPYFLDPVQASWRVARQIEQTAP